MHRFAGFELGRNDDSPLPALLEQHGLTAPLFEAVKTLLVEKQRFLKAGTIGDATIIATRPRRRTRRRRGPPRCIRSAKGTPGTSGGSCTSGPISRGEYTP
jgi:hypothetical protein